jgi:hypothetical protein
VITEGQIARHYYEDLRRKAASLKIQTCYRMHFARKHYKDLYSASTTVQSGLRGMAARSELHSRQQTKAAVIIQVCFRVSFYLSMKCGVSRQNRMVKISILPNSCDSLSMSKCFRMIMLIQQQYYGVGSII